MASGRPDFRILGRLQVVTAGAEAALGPPKQRALLALLLLHSNRPLSADWLIERLWDGKPPVTAATAVQGYISHLRKILGQESIRTELGGYSLCVEPDVVDATRFERRLAEAGELRAADRLEAAAGLLSEALAEWHGEALADFRFEAFAHD